MYFDHSKSYVPVSFTDEVYQKAPDFNRVMNGLKSVIDTAYINYFPVK